MNRRSFLKRLSNVAKLMVLTSIMPQASCAASPIRTGPDGLHYRPLNGRSLRDIAAARQHHGDGRFLNPLGLPRSGRMWQVLSWKLFHDNRFKKHFDREPVVPVSVDWGPIQRHRGVSVTFLKHAGLWITDRERSLVVDPVFFEIFWFIKDFTPLNFDVQQIPRPDHILVTHGHYDHLDKSSLATFPADTHVLSPLGYDEIFAELGMRNRAPMDWYDTYETDGFQVTFLPCNHWTMRNPLTGPNRSLWGSYLIRTASGYTIYLSGDTAYFEGFDQLGQEFDIDLAVFNLGAYEPRWFMAPSHINPAETVNAFKQLRADRLLIVHWGTFRLGDEPVHFPPIDIRKAMQAEGLQNRLVELDHGQTYFV
jgi:L-ascorbate metabolism protein UlaG (beta-lactamase superfamily)